MGRPRIHDAATRERLLDLAADAVSEHGIRGLTVRSLARSAGTSTAAVYTLFGGMAGLLSALYLRTFERFDARLRAVAVSDDPLEDLVALGRAYRTAALADPNGYRLMFGEETLVDRVSTESRDQAARAFEPLLDAVQRAVGRGFFPREPEPGGIATALWAQSHGMVTLELGTFVPPAAGDPATVFEHATRAAVAGWCARAYPRS